MRGRPLFRARLLDPGGTHIRAARQALDDQREVAVVPILVAVFDVPDTEVAFGNEERQVIDPGAFRSWIDRSDFEVNPVPFFVDHGDAHLFGSTTLTKKIGRAKAFRETEQGLVFDGHYNLKKQVARESLEDLLFDPEGSQFSFRWPEDKVEERDDIEHVVEFSAVVEVSQVAFGAQEMTGPVLAAAAGHTPVRLRTAIRPHGTGTTGDAFSAGEHRRRLPESSDALRAAHAWADPDGDADTKGAYKFIHHMVSSDGAVGDASTRACSNGIGVLNGGRSDPDIPDSDRPGVYAHLRRHLEDSGQDNIPELRSPWPSEADLEHWAQDEEFRRAASGLLVPAMRAFSVDEVQRKVWQAWDAAHPWTGNPGEPAERSFPVEVFVEGEDAARGEVIVSRGEEYQRLPWEEDSEGITFHEDRAVTVERIWQTASTGNGEARGAEHPVGAFYKTLFEQMAPGIG